VARKELEKKVGHPRFRQFFAVHEIEAWLFSDPGLFAPSVRKMKWTYPFHPPIRCHISGKDETDISVSSSDSLSYLRRFILQTKMITD